MTFVHKQRIMKTNGKLFYVRTTKWEILFFILAFILSHINFTKNNTFYQEKERKKEEFFMMKYLQKLGKA